MSSKQSISKHDKEFLSHIEQILLQLKEEYGTKDFSQLEKSILEDATEHSKDFDVMKKVEFIAFVKELLKAYDFAAERHKKQVRKSGQPYIVHPLYVALNEIYHQKHETGKYQESPIIAALLHDTVEDTGTKFSEINQKFGQRMEYLVNNLTIRPEWKQWKDENKLSSVEKAALQFVNADQDPASLSVKYDDRFHNLETLRYMDEEHQVKKMLETLSVGFISQAEDLQRYDFLIQLYISIKRFLTDEKIEQFAPDPSTAKRKRDEAAKKIKEILERNRKNLFD